MSAVPRRTSARLESPLPSLQEEDRIMKARILSVFVVCIALSSLLALAVTAQGLRSNQLSVLGSPPSAGARDVRPRPEYDPSPSDPDSPLGAPSALVYGVTCDQFGNCWFPNWNGVDVRRANGKWVHFGTADGLAHPYCHDVAVDAAGRVWVGHHFVGVSLLDYNGTLGRKSDDTWLTFRPSDGLKSESVYSVEIAPDGRVWFGLGTTTYRIAILDHKGTPFDKTDDLWSSYDNGDFGAAAGPVNAILFHGNAVWAGTDFGLVRRTGGAWSEITWSGAGCGIMCCLTWPEGIVWDLAADDRGHVWVADGRCGAAGYDGSSWTVCDTHDSGCPLSEISNSIDPGMRCVAVDEYGNKWFGTRHNRGVGRLDGHGDWTIFTQTDDDWLTSSWIEGADFDIFGAGWFAGTTVDQYVVPGSSRGYVSPGSGGTIHSPDRLAKAEFPSGSVAQDTEVTITPANSLPTGGKFGVYIFDMTAVISGTTTEVTSTSGLYSMTVNYTGETKRAAIENTIGLYSWDGDEWVDEGSTLVTETKTVSASLDHMTYFALLGDTYHAYVPVTLRSY